MNNWKLHFGRFNHRRHVFLILILTVYCAVPIRPYNREIQAKIVVQKMAHTYANLGSYEDEGVVVTAYSQQLGRWVNNQPFRIFYVRPSLVRFEWIDYALREEGDTHIIWTDGVSAFKYSEPKAYKKEESLALAIAGATGVTGGAAHTIPRLLMESIGGTSLADLTSLRLIGEHDLEGEICYRIEASHTDGVLLELWISKKNHLLRKLTTKSSLSTIEEIHRNIKINRPIEKSLFKFMPS